MAEKKNEAQNEQKNEKKKKGVIIGVIGLAAAAAVAVPLALKGCAPGEKSFTVTFLTDEEVEGFHQGSMNVKDGTTIGSLKNQLAPLEGYDFAGFYKDENCTTPFDDSEVVNDNTKIYVAYEEKKFTLKFYNEGEVIGGEPIATIDVYYYKTIKQSLAIDGKDTSMPKPTKTEGDYGYEFTGWQVFGNVEKVFHNKDFQSMKGKDILELDADGEAELVATFSTSKERLYTVTYNENMLEVRKGNEPIKNGDKVLSGSRLTIVSKYGELKDDFFMNLQVEGANLVEEDGLYHVTGNVSIEASIGHRYLTFNKLDDGTYEVTGRSDETDVIIPAFYYDGSKITSINAPGFGSGYPFLLNSLTFGENITSIKGNPFLNGVPKEVNFLGTVDQWASIDFSNWTNCPLNSATTFKIKGEVLTEATINVDVNDYAFYYAKTLTKVTIGNNCKSIGDNAFYYCTSLTSVVIGSGVTSIGNNAFYHCNSLTGELLIPDSVTSIVDYAFAYCSGLESVVIGNGVTSIGGYAFQECSGLTSVVIGEKVTSIDNGAFTICTKLEKITWNAISVKDFTLSNSIFYKAGQIGKGIEVIFGDKVQNIPAYCFYPSSTAPNISSVTIGEGVTSIGNYAFRDCTAITKITWNAISVKDFAANNYVFYYVGQKGEGIELIFGDKVQRIPAYCFYPYDYTPSNTQKIITITIGNSVTSIGDYAFSSCGSLESVVIGNSVTSIGNRAFSACGSLKSLVIGNSVTSIGNSAFQSCSGLTSIVIPNSVTSIGNYAFQSCSGLTSIVIPNSVTGIGQYAFYNCSSLISIVIPDSVTSIGDRVFYGCSSLTSIVIPNSVNSIGNYAFNNCSKLSVIYYGGAEEDWGLITTGTNNAPLDSATIYYFSEKQPTGTGNYWHWEDVDGVQTPTVWTKGDEE